MNLVIFQPKMAFKKFCPFLWCLPHMPLLLKNWAIPPCSFDILVPPQLVLHTDLIFTTLSQWKLIYIMLSSKSASHFMHSKFLTSILKYKRLFFFQKNILLNFFWYFQRTERTFGVYNWCPFWTKLVPSWTVHVGLKLWYEWSIATGHIIFSVIKW